MIVYRGLDAIETASSSRPRVAVLGMFDGVHVGHQHLLTEVRAWAGETAGVAVVTFDRHPQEVLGQGQPRKILSLEHKLRLLERAGVGTTLVLEFDELMSRWSAAVLRSSTSTIRMVG